MKKYIFTALFAAILMTAGISSSASAKEMRWPETGVPYLTFAVPAHWVAKPDYKDMSINLMPEKMTKDTLQVVTIGYETYKPLDLTSKNFEAIMTNILGGINSSDKVQAKPFYQRHRNMISGITWDRFSTSLSMPSSGVKTATRIFVCAGPSSLMALSFSSALPRFSADMHKILGSVRAYGIKSCPLNDAK